MHMQVSFLPQKAGGETMQMGIRNYAALLQGQDQLPMHSPPYNISFGITPLMGGIKSEWPFKITSNYMYLYVFIF